MPIKVQIAGSRGLVWNIQDILHLRTHYRLVGSMVGSIAGFHSQVSVLGLPLQLSPEEVTLALRAGWIELYETSLEVPTAAAAADAPSVVSAISAVQNQDEPAAAAAAGTARAAAPPAVAAAADNKQSSSSEQVLPGQQQQQEQQPMQLDAAAADVDADAEVYDEFYAAYYGLQPPQKKQQQQQHVDMPQQQQQQQQRLQKQQQQQQSPWVAAVSSGSRITVPLTIEDAATIINSHTLQQQQQQQQPLLPLLPQRQPPLLPQQQQQQQQHVCCCRSASCWAYPQTPLQQLRLAVFSDLHSRGFCVTGGAKFGGDFLAYPGDPHLFHAQYVVRVLEPQQQLNPVVLQGLARGVHAARKHLVLATVQHTGLKEAAAAVAAVGGSSLVCGSGLSVVPGAWSSLGENDAAAAVDAEVGVGGGDGRDDGLQRAAAAAVVAEAAAAATAAGLLGSNAAAAADGSSSFGGGMLRYITIARESGWGRDEQQEAV